MKRVTQQWWGAGLVAVASVFAVAATSFAAETDSAGAYDAKVSNADRAFRNFTYETATLSEGQVRVELRGLKVGDKDEIRLNTIGLRVRRVFPNEPVSSLDDGEVSGGQIDLLTSYGFAKGAEIGMDIPMIIESIRFSDGSRKRGENIGDVRLYGKFQQDVATHCAVGAGLDMSLPTAPGGRNHSGDGFGTGEIGATPFVSARYQNGRVGFGANLGYQFYSGDVSNVFHYGAEAVVRPHRLFALRTEIAGRVFSEVGENWQDLTLLPGVDYRLTDWISIRPTGIVGLTHTALDWGIGLGLAATL